MKEFILSIVVALVAMFTSEIDFTSRIFLVFMVALLSMTTILSNGRSYLQKNKAYNLGYYSQILLVIIFSTYLIFYKHIGFLNSFSMGVVSLSVHLLILFPITMTPLVKYRNGIYTFFPNPFRVPVGGRDLEIIIENKTLLDADIDLELTLPSNVYFEDSNLHEIKNKIFLKGKSRKSLKFSIASRENKINKIAKIKINSNLKKTDQHSFNIIT